MTCARRPAGARSPAPSTSAGAPRKADARSGRSRARLSRLLPALALLLGALSPFAAAPAQAQDVWSATLNPVVDGFNNVGCYSSGDSRACSDSDVLKGDDGDDFVHNTVTYTIVRITDQADSNLRVHFSGTGITKAAFSGLSFCVGTTPFAFSSASVEAGAAQSRFVWSSAGLSWASGTPVNLKIAASCATSTTPDAPTFDPAHNAVINDPTSNITLTFTEAIKADASNTDFSNTTIDSILTLKTRGGGAGSADIPFDATIDSAGKVVTVNPTGDLPETLVQVAISNDWYDADGNQGEAASATFQMVLLRPLATFSPGAGDTVTNASGNITVTFTEAIKADASNTDFTNSSIDNILTLKVGSASGANIAFDATINSGKTVVTIDPTADLPAGKVHVAISNAYYNAAGIQGSAEGHTFTVAPASNVPTGLSVTTGNAQLTASWTAPSGVDVARYEAQIKLKSAASWPTGDTDVTGTSHTFTGLTNGSPYQVRVRTVETGEGVASDWTAPAEGTPAAPVVAPSVPQNVQVTPGDGKLTMTWEAPSSWGTWTPDAYCIDQKISSETGWATVRGDGVTEGCVSSTTTSFIYTGSQASSDQGSDLPVTNGTAYDLRISAWTFKPGGDRSAFNSDFKGSDWVTVTNTVPAAQAPPTVTLSVSPNPVLEGSSTTVTVTLSRALSGAVTIPVPVTAGSAESGDYTVVATVMSGSILMKLSAGETSGTVRILANQDADEEDETLTVALGTLPSTVTAGTETSVTLTITDDDGQELSVDTSHPTPACGAAVTDLAVRPETGLRLTPPPTGATAATQVRILASYGPAEGWRASLPIRRYDRLPTYGHSGFIRGITFAELRKNFPGFRGFEYRLTDTPAITAQCTWQFDDEGGGGTGTDARLRNLQMNSGN